MKRRISVVTGSRAEYGSLYWIIHDIEKDPQLELQLIVTGMHLSPEFGSTVNDILSDGFFIADKIEMLLSADSQTAITTSMGVGMIGFAKSYERLRPHILLLLGDRFETFAAAAASVPFNIPIAHIHGGEATEGAIDDRFRHGITKLSHIHFAANELYARRIIQMGENPERVFCYGAPGLDHIHKLKLLNTDQIKQELDLPKNKRIGIVTYHPETVEEESADEQISKILSALKKFSEIFWIITLPNSDTGGRIIAERIKTFASDHPSTSKTFASLGHRRYLSLLGAAEIMVGNSSSGLIEAPSFALPVVNLGIRQDGRIKAENVIDARKFDVQILEQAISKGLSFEFKDSLRNISKPYVGGAVSEKIVDTLKAIRLNKELIMKRFYDLPHGTIT